MIAGSRIPIRIIVLLALLCLALLAWTTFGFVVPFKQETGQSVLDTYIVGYDQPVVERMRILLSQNEAGRDLLRSMYFGPELILPTLLASLLFLVALKIQPSTAEAERPAHKAFMLAAFALPVIYGISDYAENICGLIIIGNDGFAHAATLIMPWATRLKFLALAIFVSLVFRAFLLRLSRGGADSA